MTEALENQVKSKVTIKVNFLFYFSFFKLSLCYCWILIMDQVVS